MELLVKKASLALFLKEQYTHHERQVLDEVERNPSLREHLQRANETSEKLAALNEEIEANPNVRQLKEIIVSATRKPLTIDDLIRDLPFPFDAMSKVGLVVGRAISNLLLTIIK